MYEQYEVVKDILRGTYAVLRTVIGEKKGGGLTTHRKEIVADGKTFEEASEYAHRMRLQ